MSEKKLESVAEAQAELPTLSELGYEPSEEGGGSIESQERVALADQRDEKPEEKEQEQVEEKEAESKQEVAKEATSDEPVYTEVEKQARQQGWTPKDQFKGDPAIWKDAATFIEHGDLMGKLGSSHRKIKDMQKAIDNMTMLITKQKEKADEQEKADLTAKRRVAINDGDVETVEAYDQQIKQLEPQPEQQQTHPPETLDFVHENADWFNSDTADNAAMRAFAISVDNQLAKNFPQMPLTQRYAKTKEKVVGKFPTYFNPNQAPATYRAAQPKMESAKASQAVKSKKVTIDDMPPEARKIAMNLWRASGKKISLDDYAKELIRTGAVEL